MNEPRTQCGTAVTQALGDDPENPSRPSSRGPWPPLLHGQKSRAHSGNSTPSVTWLHHVILNRRSEVTLSSSGVFPGAGGKSFKLETLPHSIPGKENDPERPCFSSSDGRVGGIRRGGAGEKTPIGRQWVKPPCLGGVLAVLPGAHKS